MQYLHMKAMKNFVLCFTWHTLEDKGMNTMSGSHIGQTQWPLDTSVEQKLWREKRAQLRSLHSQL